MKSEMAQYILLRLYISAIVEMECLHGDEFKDIPGSTLRILNHG